MLGWCDGDVNLFPFQYVIVGELMLNSGEAVFGHTGLMLGCGQCNAPLGFGVGIDLDALLVHGFLHDGMVASLTPWCQEITYLLSPSYISRTADIRAHDRARAAAQG